LDSDSKEKSYGREEREEDADEESEIYIWRDAKGDQTGQ
jgi:hypothetical protein